MEDRRRKVFRRQPIEIELDGGLELVARPLPWQARNDLGDMVMQAYIGAMNSALQAMQDEPDAAPQLSGGLADKFRDPGAVFKAAFPVYAEGEFDLEKCQLEDIQISKLSYVELIECILVALEVNQLDTLRPLIDPNFRVPDQNSGNGALETVDVGLKSTSSDNSSAPALPEERS